jgi:hypothetical protein
MAAPCASIYEIISAERINPFTPGGHVWCERKRGKPGKEQGFFLGKSRRHFLQVASAVPRIEYQP